MKLGKWLGLFALGAALAGGLYGLFSAAVDPFGVFGDRVLDDYAYDMTQNPRVAKIAYLQDHFDDYDSYIIGSSKVASLSCETFGGYTGGKYYNLTWYGGKLGDEIRCARYLLEHDEVRHMVLMFEPQNALDFATDTGDLKERMHCATDGSSPFGFYGSYLFCHPQYAVDKITAEMTRGYLVTPDAVYLPETGVYNKQRRDVAVIGSLEDYEAENGYQFPSHGAIGALSMIDPCAQAVAELRQLCAEKGVELTVCAAAQYDEDLLSYDRADIARLWRAMAQTGPFWDFSGLSSISGDPRYFYDANHFRNAVGDMMAARIYGDDSVWTPQGFGSYVTADNVDARLAEMYHPHEEALSKRVPILMYHSLTDDPAQKSAYTVLDRDFEDHLAALFAAGYQSVGYDQLADYVFHGAQLPEKCVVITFDDGYENNLTLGAPLLEKYGFQAQIAVIGTSAGKDRYKDTGHAMTPHFAIADALPWVEKGVVRLNSHTYDMHQVPELDGEDCRQGVQPLPGESDWDYAAALQADFAASQAQLAPARATDQRAVVITYPYGLTGELTEVVMAQAGANVTLTTDPGTAEIVRGLPQSLRRLPRHMIADATTTEELLALLEQ